MKTFVNMRESEMRVDDGWVEETVRYPVAAEVDVVVAGGGPAGLGAAIGAARQGASTLLVERNSFLGGTATAVQMATWNVAVEHMTGYAQEIAQQLVDQGGAVGGGSTVPFDPESVKQLALEHIAGSGVRLLLYSSVCGPVMEGDTVKGIVVENKSGRRAILGKTVVDCTGDADVAARAGAQFVMGRESDSLMRPMTALVRLGGLDLKTMVDYAKSHPDEFDQTGLQVLDMENGLLRIVGFFRHAADAQARGELDPKINYLRFEGVQVDKGVAFLNSVRVYHVDGTDAFDLTKAEVEAREQIEQLVPFLKHWIPGCENAYVIDTSSNMGVRETRRIVGAHTLTEEEIKANRHLDDGIAKIWRYHAFGREQHSPDPGVEGNPNDPRRVGLAVEKRTFEIPYGCLLPKEVDGLLVAGRSISTTHLADTWTRGMYCCMVTGQAAGIAAAIAARREIPPREVELTELRNGLRRQNVDLGDPAGFIEPAGAPSRALG